MQILTHKIGGAWNIKEKALHINYKELLAVHYCLRSSIFDDIMQNIWLFCFKNKIWITAAHIPRTENVIADYESRKSYKNAEWILNPEIFQKAIEAAKI